MANDYEIFEGKSLSGLFKDIYDNTERNKTAIRSFNARSCGFHKRW